MITHSAELPAEYLRYALLSLSQWNSSEGVQVIVLSQRKDSEDLREICGKYGDRVELLETKQPFVGKYPIWDVTADIATYVDKIQGRWIAPFHSEFVWGTDRVQRTLAWLRDKRPYLALGNLRRPGLFSTISRSKFPTCSQEISEGIIRDIDAGLFMNAAQRIDTEPSTAWLYWCGEAKPGQSRWIEDIFFADWDWLRLTGMFELNVRMPFQDIYDVMGTVVNNLSSISLLPPITRMPQDVNRALHLWHAKPWSSWTQEIKDWFFADPEPWKGTQFLNEARWAKLMGERSKNPLHVDHPVLDVRRGPGGTLTLFSVVLGSRLKNGNSDRLRKFHGENGMHFRKTYYREEVCESI